jgi:hypothetical protein
LANLAAPPRRAVKIKLLDGTPVGSTLSGGNVITNFFIETPKGSGVYDGSGSSNSRNDNDGVMAPEGISWPEFQSHDHRRHFSPSTLRNVLEVESQEIKS